MKFKLSFLAIIAVATFISPTYAAIINWQNSVIVDDAGAFVDTTGNLVAAVNADDPGDDVTIGGVNFLGNNVANWNAGIAGAGGVTIASNTANGNFGTTFVQGGGPPPGITDAAINNLLGSAIWNPQTVTLSNLVIGDTYRIQIIGNDSRDGRHSGFVSVLTDGVNGAADSIAMGTAGLNVISNGPSGVNPALPGSAIIGTFVADATTQVFNVFGSTNGGASTNSGGRAQINGFQLRTIPIPEPCSLVMLLFSAVGLVFFRKRRIVA